MTSSFPSYSLTTLGSKKPGQVTRDSVYSYLTAIYEVVEWWSADGKAESRARRALARHNIKKPEVIEPFAALIVASAHPTILDKRMISKWSRVLRYAAKFKSPSEPLAEFFEGRGGINDCAARYARRLGRRAPPETTSIASCAVINPTPALEKLGQWF